MRTYGQYCPIARGAEIFAERWTPLIIRNLYLGCGWGARWLEIAPEHLDPFVALWSMSNALRRDRLPNRRVVIRFERPHRERYWLLIELGDTEICKTDPGIRQSLQCSDP